MKINLVSIVSKTVALDNSNLADRNFDISANVEIRSDKVNTIESGILTDKSNGNVVSFSTYGGTSNMRVEFNGTEDRAAVIAALNEFVTAVETYASENA